MAEVHDEHSSDYGPDRGKAGEVEPFDPRTCGTCLTATGGRRECRKPVLAAGGSSVGRKSRDRQAFEVLENGVQAEGVINRTVPKTEPTVLHLIISLPQVTGLSKQSSL